jgi:hypothetical protein
MWKPLMKKTLTTELRCNMMPGACVETLCYSVHVALTISTEDVKTMNFFQADKITLNLGADSATKAPTRCPSVPTSQLTSWKRTAAVPEIQKQEEAGVKQARAMHSCQ